MSPKPELTGQLIVREAGKQNRRRLLIVCGIIAVPDSLPLEGESQYIASGAIENGQIALSIYPDSKKDLTEDLRGSTPNQWLTSPIWRI